MSTTVQPSAHELQTLGRQLDNQIDYLPAETQTQVVHDAEKYDVAAWQILRLIKMATEAKYWAYCPYSNFQVGCAALTLEEKVFSGANVENAAYPVGTCAERCCFSRAVTEGYRRFKAVAVATNAVPAGSPCGMCRQFMKEFCSENVPVFLVDKNGAYTAMTMGQLLPCSFGPENLR